MDIKLAISALLLTPAFAQAQADTINPYYKKFENSLAVQAFALNTSNNFSINYVQDNLIVDIIPNQKTTLGIAVQYDIISFSIGFAPKIFANNRDNGGSRMTSYALNFFPRRFMQHFDLYYQRGMSLAVSGTDLYLPRLKSLKIGGNTSYFFNSNFSYRATAFQSEKQLKSAGSFSPSLTYYYTELNGKEEPLLGDKSYFIDVALCPGYYYNWVIAKDFLVSGGASFGAGMTTTVDNDTTTELLIAGALQIAMGYNSERLFCGVNLRANFFSHEAEQDVVMSNAISYATAFAGYRFDPPGFIAREKEKLYKKLK
ncbi:DUF4421 domain-containing protein [Flavobacterium sp. J372]|uniref:DUF4421 domain-containing protein n=1 Tax=Flavobacterium sp. J372 TaxID=2898436 RepID=UPI002150FA05|nr:DUF4421 domain-containing protein [Flavobacterium sp. J372]MCR5860956.1 DUF4421 domain-containing protein [Flavobacterium sp. J372]